MIKAVIFATFCCLCSADWLNILIGTEDVAKSSNDDYNGYEQAPYTVVTTIDVRNWTMGHAALITDNSPCRKP